MPHLGKKHVGHRAASLTTGVDVIGKEVIRDKLIGLGLRQFQFDQVSQLVFFATLRGLAERNRLWFLITDGHDEAVVLHTEVVPHGRFQFDFLDRRNLHVLRREDQLQIRRPVRVGNNLKLSTIAIGPFLRVEQVELELRRSVNGDSHGVDCLCAVRVRFI